MTSPKTRRRATVWLTVAGASAIAVAIVAVVAASASSVTQPAPAVSPTESARPATAAPATSAAPSPVPAPAPAASSLVLSATGFALQGEDGSVLFTHEWLAPAEPAVAALSDAFGSPPTQSVRVGNPHAPDYTLYTWPGFTLLDGVFVEGTKPRTEYTQPSFVELTANDVNGLPVAAEFGLRIGMSLADARAIGPDDEWQTRIEPFETRLLYARDRSVHGDGPVSYSVVGSTGANGTALEIITYQFFSGL